jgi:hypothetical protein
LQEDLKDELQLTIQLKIIITWSPSKESTGQAIKDHYIEEVCENLQPVRKD